MAKWIAKFNSSDEKEALIKKLADAGAADVTVEGEEELSEEDKKKAEEAKKKADEEAMMEKEEMAKMSQKVAEQEKTIAEITKLSAEKDAKIATMETEVAKIPDLQKQVEKFTSEAKEITAAKDQAVADLAEKTLKLDKFEKDARTEAIKSFVKTIVAEGKVLPKDEPTIVALMEQLDDKQVIKLSKDSKETSEPVMEVLKSFISGLPKAVEFKEISPDIEHKVYDKKVSIGGVNYEVTNQELVQEIEKYAQDNKVSFDQAMIAVTASKK